MSEKNHLQVVENPYGSRGVQTSVNLPFTLYIQVIQKAETEGVSLAEIVRRAVKKEFHFDTA